MGVAGHDLAGSYQKAHDRCAIWSAFVWRFGFFFSGCSGITTSQWHWSCQCLGCPTSHFLCWPQGDERSWLVPESSQYDSYSGVVVYNKIHVWILHEWFCELIFQKIRIHCHHGVNWKLELFSLVIWLLEQYFELRFGWVFALVIGITWSTSCKGSCRLLENKPPWIHIHCSGIIIVQVLSFIVDIWFIFPFYLALWSFEHMIYHHLDALRV